MESSTIQDKKWESIPEPTILKKMPGSFILFFLSLLAILFNGCNSDKKAEPEEKKGETQISAFATPKYWPYFKLDSAAIEALIARSDSALKYKAHKSVILEHLLTNISGDSVFVKLLGFPSLHHGHHGRLSQSFEIRDSFKFKALDTIILGNNYLDWGAIGEVIFIRTGPDRGKLKPDFSYILFEPMNTYEPGQHPNCTMCKNHLWYQITAYDRNGNPMKGLGGGGSGSTNPSPPADPTN